MGIINVVKDSVEKKGGGQSRIPRSGCPVMRMQKTTAQTSVVRWKGQSEDAQPLVGVERLWPKTELGWRERDGSQDKTAENNRGLYSSGATKEKPVSSGSGTRLCRTWVARRLRTQGRYV